MRFGISAEIDWEALGTVVHHPATASTAGDAEEDRCLAVMKLARCLGKPSIGDGGQNVASGLGLARRMRQADGGGGSPLHYLTGPVIEADWGADQAGA